MSYGSGSGSRDTGTGFEQLQAAEKHPAAHLPCAAAVGQFGHFSDNSNPDGSRAMPLQQQLLQLLQEGWATCTSNIQPRGSDLLQVGAIKYAYYGYCCLHYYDCTPEFDMVAVWAWQHC